MKRIIYIIILVVSLMSCEGHSEHWTAISQIETYIEGRPDSALAVLQAISPDDLIGKDEKALYALMMSMAMDKNYVDVKSDSLIMLAVDYYDEHPDIEKRFLSYYYLGRVQDNGGHYTKAMLSFAKAEELIEEFADKSQIGLLYVHIGLINERVYDYPKSVDAYNKAFDYFVAAGNIIYQYYLRLSIGQVLFNLKQYDAAETHLTETMEWAYDNEDYYLCQSCFETLIMLYEQQADDKALFLLYESPYAAVCEDDMILSQSLAYMSAYRNEEDKASKYLERAWDNASDMSDTTILLFKEYRINKLLGAYDKALNTYEKLFQMQDSIVRHTLQQPILTAQNDYFKSQAEYNALKLRHNRQVSILIFIVLAFVFFAVMLYVRYRMVAKNSEINRNMEMIHDLEASLFSKDKDVSRMTSDAVQMNQQINELFVRQFELIDKLSKTYYETHGTSKEKDAIYSQVKCEIENLRTDKKYILQLEDIVNKYKNNVMRFTREEMPQFSEMDYRLLCFLYAGFSAKAISIFTGDSIGNIYMRKSRLKSKISESDSPNREHMVGCLI